jgi:hypothetical protein
MRHAAMAVAFAFAFGCGAAGPPPAALPALVANEPANLIDADTYTARVASLRATLARSGIELDTRRVISVCGAHHGIDDCMRCDVASRADTSGVDPDMIDAVALAFARYPTSVLTAAHLQHVALCRRIRYDHDHGEGVNPAGVAIFEDARLVVSIEFFSDQVHEGYSDFTIEQVVHHELFHMLDRASHGEQVYADHEWHALNAPSFVYRDPSPSGVPRPPGFVDSYATTSELEDRASVFEYLMGQPAKLCEIARADPIVAAKTRMVWSRAARIMGAQRLPREAMCAGRKPTPPTPIKPARPARPGKAAGKPTRTVPVRLPSQPSLVGKMR